MEEEGGDTLTESPSRIGGWCRRIIIDGVVEPSVTSGGPLLTGDFSVDWKEQLKSLLLCTIEKA